MSVLINQLRLATAFYQFETQGPVHVAPSIPNGTVPGPLDIPYSAIPQITLSIDVIKNNAGLGMVLGAPQLPVIINFSL